MRDRRIFPILLMLAAVFGCGDQRKGDDFKGDDLKSEDRSKSRASSAEVPHLVDEKGKRFPYFAYERGSDPFDLDDRQGFAMFIHPIFDIRNKGLALHHLPGQDVKELFGEELFGGEFMVVDKAGILTVEGLPISRPSQSRPGATWKMVYGEKEFECVALPKQGDRFAVGCVASDLRLNAVFDDARGVASFQNFCAKGVCTYHLKSSVGLLSPYHLRAIAPEKSADGGSPELVNR